MTDLKGLEIGNTTESSIDKEFAAEIFASLSKFDGVVEYMEQTMAEDVKRYFNAVDDTDRNQIKGHFAFASYMRSQILATRE